jgi:hypothetical protein
MGVGPGVALKNHVMDALAAIEAAMVCVIESMKAKETQQTQEGPETVMEQKFDVMVPVTSFK